MEREIVIKAEKVKKVYRLGVIGSGTLRRDLQSFFAKLRKKEDPNTLVGTKNKNGLFTALDDVDFEIYKGEKVGIIGHNGAGKTTLLKLLTRITGPTSGEIYINGKISSLLEVGTGFSAELTGRENIFFNGAMLGMKKSEIKEKMESIIEFSECREFMDTPLKRYSMGMFVKLAFAIAVHLNSDIVLMDEVLAVGDVAFQKKCIEKMQEIANEEGRTILYVSHNMETIKNLCDRCIVLEKGKKIFDGDVDKGIECYLNSTENNKKED